MSLTEAAQARILAAAQPLPGDFARIRLETASPGEPIPVGEPVTYTSTSGSVPGCCGHLDCQGCAWECFADEGHQEEWSVELRAMVCSLCGNESPRRRRPGSVTA